MSTRGAAACEDRAVDLYVLERAVVSMHCDCGDALVRILGLKIGCVCANQLSFSWILCVLVSANVCATSEGRRDNHFPLMFTTDIFYALSVTQFETVLAAYLEDVTDSTAMASRFQQVRQRGRKRLAFG